MSYKVYPHWFPLREQVYDTLEEAVTAHMYDLTYRSTDFRILNTYDCQRVDHDRILEIYNRVRKARANRYYGPSYEFRNGPIPGIRCKRMHRGSYSRRPKTLAELRDIAGIEYDEEMVEHGIKARRARYEVPTNWDDITRASRYDRSWKNHRQTQYKEK